MEDGMTYKVLEQGQGLEGEPDPYSLVSMAILLEGLKWSWANIFRWS